MSDDSSPTGTGDPSSEDPERQHAESAVEGGAASGEDTDAGTTGDTVREHSEDPAEG